MYQIINVEVRAINRVNYKLIQDVIEDMIDHL